MPLKKKRPTRKKPSAKKVAAMPSLVFAEGELPPAKLTGEEITTTPQRQTTEVDSPTLQFIEYSKRQEAARRWMWLGVASFSAMIFLLWGWSLYVKMTSLHWKKGSDYSLVDTAKKDWNAVFEQNTAEQLQTGRTKEQLKEALSAVVTQMNATSSNASSSVSSTTTTSKR